MDIYSISNGGCWDQADSRSKTPIPCGDDSHQGQELQQEVYIGPRGGESGTMVTKCPSCHKPKSLNELSQFS